MNSHPKQTLKDQIIKDISHATGIPRNRIDPPLKSYDYCPHCGQLIRTVNGLPYNFKFRGVEFTAVICKECVEKST
jgi:hydrogenase maturation factor HypF (carbamoyltransferase family)